MIKTIVMAAAISTSTTAYSGNFISSVAKHLEDNGMSLVKSMEVRNIENGAGSVGAAVMIVKNNDVHNRLCIVETDGYTYCMKTDDYYAIRGKK